MTIRNSTLMTMTLEKVIQIYISTLETEGKSPRYLDWLRTRMQYFITFVRERYGEDFNVRDLTVATVGNFCAICSAAR
ncbi:MAG TPA: hypothetical protein VLZ89_13225 [Anaerolineales bacterium]|nr:hypothetical protein [Anaerolineales bacterium]